MLAYSLNLSDSANAEAPVLVFLHGLLGSGKDWQACLNELNGYSTVTLDLPGHGDSVAVPSLGFDDVCQHIEQTLTTIFPPQQTFILVSYSLGGRIAMYGIAHHHFEHLNLMMAIIEGAHFGLDTADMRQARYENDFSWSQRFKKEPIAQVLNDWYQQAVFSSLNHEQRQTLIAKRSDNLGAEIGQMLLATSLAKQPLLLEPLARSAVPIHYICGEKDTKFSQLAEQSGLSFSQIAQAGHNVHHEQPRAFANVIKHLIQTHESE
ncbi:2-succinyl-6-hydroxy-2,4-cyclohexadiene-1-carboxylate synthase [Vibrio renipiscarius]|uniref:Putative 2-succinyl-6-hydroxy-2,4-cyclohexadiene-1-carboxylate synthase n=1 Tax=Vibrio renipiscarius TaxID=1461322 RepID=A0A0C2NU02_9VIBR|nr:2-succinyl-6-hydroxy-2,4-cyclohexadiene-1-carboxylate synthase [Vibrio renipiscarius]KII79660.1 2-succinyl-6-hydroxy-2,4-cyclohexadiene-1-carboxylate synthase [Vibrio renipiscarius]KII80712.1 2-succinyl-6-hydroxy-2,4-cyclohexadiene-1-carboxylate synthase [Vibrio renipiscarius]